MMRAAVELGPQSDGVAQSDSVRRECKICWHVYDPALGDEVWQIAPGTAFEALPEHWRCPVCDAAKDAFLVLD
jgi:rubredoxin